MKAFPLLSVLILGTLGGMGRTQAQTNYDPYLFATLAGKAGTPGSVDGTGDAARFDGLHGVAVDNAGNVFVADANNNTIRKITTAGVVSVFAGAAGVPGSADGTGSAARFDNPRGVTVDTDGNVYVADNQNSTIRKITPSGVVTTLAGSPGVDGSANGTGSAARFFQPLSVAVDSAFNVYVADFGNSTIRKITSAGVVSTLAGSPGKTGSADGVGSAARFNFPVGVTVDEAFNVYVADTDNHTVRKITPAGVVTTVAGSAGKSGSADGTGSDARFSRNRGITIDGGGNMYVGDSLNNTIRKITSGGVVTTLAGVPGVAGSADGTGSAAQFDFPGGVSVDGVGHLYVGDTANDTVRIGASTAPAQPLNVSTRLRVLTGERVLIGGFIITGSDLKKVIIRGIGPSLSGVGNTLPDPTLELHKPDGSVVSNDNWKINDQTGQSQEAEIRATSIPPANDLDSVILAMLGPGAYTAILAGKGQTTGVGLVEVYDLTQSANSKLANISTRGFVDTGDNVIIGGFILGGGVGASKVLARAVGPSLTQAGIANALVDPSLELHDGNGAVISSNDNWKDAPNAADIQATGIPPSDERESAILATLAPGNYTAVASGKGATTGVGLVEIYNLQ